MPEKNLRGLGRQPHQLNINPMKKAESATRQKCVLGDTEEKKS
jgi:hypothetical protein